MAGPIRISILADDRASRVFGSVGTSAGGMGSKVTKAGKALGLALVAGTALAGAAALKFGKDSVKAASDAQQSLGATETVFGKYADTVIKSSKKAATAVGISANEYRELSNVTGALLNGAGVPMSKLAGITSDLNKRAADMAATFGGTTREAVEAVSSLMKGAGDPVEKYGVSIRQADVNARLAAKGQDELTGAARKQAEMMARVDLLMKATSRTQGAFARESNTLAHQQQVLGAQWENLKAKVGTALLPVLTRLLTTLNENLMPAFEAVSAAVGPVVERIKDLFTSAGEGQGVLASVGDFLTTKFAPAAQAVADAYQNLAGVLLPILAQIADAILTGWAKIEPKVSSIWGSVQSIITDALSIVQSVVKGATTAIRTVWEKFGGHILKFITTTMENIATVLEGAFKILEGLFKTVSSVLKGDWSGAWEGIKTILSGALDVIKGAVRQAWNMIKTTTSTIWDGIKAVIRGAWDGIKTLVSNQIDRVVDLVTAIPGRITSIASGMFDGIKNAFRGAVNWIIDAWNGLSFSIPGFDPPGPGPKFAGITISTPNIPRLATGGITTGPMLAMIGDNPGGREAVIPLDRYDLSGKRLVQLLEQLLVAVKGQADTPPSPTPIDVTINVTAPVGASSADIGRDLQSHLTAYFASGGRRLAIG